MESQRQSLSGHVIGRPRASKRDQTAGFRCDGLVDAECRYRCSEVRPSRIFAVREVVAPDGYHGPRRQLHGRSEIRRSLRRAGPLAFALWWNNVRSSWTRDPTHRPRAIPAQCPALLTRGAYSYTLMIHIRVLAWPIHLLQTLPKQLQAKLNLPRSRGRVGDPARAGRRISRGL